MQIPIPDRFRFRNVLLCVLLVFVGQALEGTDPVYCALSILYLLLFAVAYNVSGGLQYTSGAYIFFNAFFTVILGLIGKLVLREPADSNLHSPRLTMAVYCVSTVGLIVAAFLASRFRLRPPLLRKFDSLDAIWRASIVCLIVGALLSFAIPATEREGGTLLSAIAQVNRFSPMAVMLGTVYEVRRSNGRRSLNWVVIIGLIIPTVMGVVFASKGAIFSGPLSWLLAASMTNYNFSKKQIAAGILTFSFAVYYLVPYVQYTRNVTSGLKLTQRLEAEVVYLGNLSTTRELYLAREADLNLDGQWHLFNTNQGFLDRAVMMAPDDSLIAFTAEGNYFGITPTTEAYENLVPRFIWKDKSLLMAGNQYAHELGLGLSDDDTTTGISFSLASEVFHQAGWTGLIFMIPFQMFLVFIVTDSLVGSAKQAPWALSLIFELSHLAPEGGITATVYLISYAVAGMLVLYFSIKYAERVVQGFKSRRRLAPSLSPPSLPRGPVSTQSVL